MYERNELTPEEIPEFFNGKINEGYAIAITLLFDHGASKCDAIRMKKRVDDLLSTINKEHFSQIKGELKLRYYKGDKSIQFAAIGYIENLNTNYHLHLLLRPAERAVIDQAFVDRFSAHWHRICPFSRSVDFARRSDGFHISTPDEYLDQRRSVLKDGITKANIGWANYFTKNVIKGEYAGKLFGDSEIFI